MGCWVRGISLAWLLGLSVASQAAGPVDVYEFPDAATEARYRALIDDFRCPKCLNTNLSGSDAPIAQDLRRTVHRLVVTESFSDAEVREYLQERYGDFVLYDPPFQPGTWLLWLAPLLFGGLGCLALWKVLRRPVPRAQLSTDEQSRLARLLRDADTPAAGPERELQR